MDKLPQLLQARVEMFKRGIYDFIVIKDGKHHKKQEQALKILNDNKHVEFLYGGAAGGAKTWTGCSNLTFNCLAYENTVWFVGRASLKRLRESVHLTFHKVFKEYGIRAGVDVKFNGQDNYWEFFNGSKIFYLDLEFQPRDPLYERYGSVEYTGGWIEEGGEVNFGAFDTLKTRVGRQGNDEHGLLRKIFITCNPKKNWLYNMFYKPSINGTIKDHQYYLGALVQDNPFNEEGYIEALMSTTDKVKKERLLKGNWDYDDNPDAMVGYDEIVAMFDNDLVEHSNDFYLTADIARFGSDIARIGVWRGWDLIEVVSYSKSSTKLLQDTINHLRRKYRIPKNQAIADEDGVGGGVVDNCDILGFLNGSKPFDEENYQHLQSQCAYKLAERINNSQVGISADLSQDDKELIILELGQLQTYKSDEEGKLRIKPKEKIKEDIGHSPDWRDLLLMRCYFDYKPARKKMNYSLMFH